MVDIPNAFDYDVDVLICGGGALGAVFVHYLAGKEGVGKVLVCEAGASLAPKPGEHMKNSYFYQRDIDAFTNIISGQLQPISVPVDTSFINTISPQAFNPTEAFRKNGQNKQQVHSENLTGAASTYCVGGMLTHWTCAIPRYLTSPEAPNATDFNEGWHKGVRYVPPEGGEDFPQALNEFYSEVENHIYKKSTDLYNHSWRHKVVKNEVEAFFKKECEDPAKCDIPEIRELPMAGQFAKTYGPGEFHAHEFHRVKWTAVDHIYENAPKDSEKFTLLTEHVVKKLFVGDSTSGDADTPSTITYAQVKRLDDQKVLNVRAKYVIVACNPVLTGQLLWASNIGRNQGKKDGGKVTNYRDLPVGRFLSEHPMAFCQIILKQDLMTEIKNGIKGRDPADVVATYDKTGMPYHEPGPNVWIPATPKRPWHCQVHRDAFSYGAVPPNVDERAVVDLRWFGAVAPNFDNWIQYSDRYCPPEENHPIPCNLKSLHEENTDRFGMPQPTFHFSLRRCGADDAKNIHDMMAEMTKVASHLGGFFPGTEPKLMPPGLAMHFTGVTRIGKRNDGESVANTHSRVWLFDNLYIAGAGVIPTTTVANPTLTAACFAKIAALQILQRLQEQAGKGKGKNHK